MKNPLNFKKEETFEFSKGELVVFKEFLRDMVPFSADRWPTKDRRPDFEGLPQYKLTAAIEDDEDDEPVIMVMAKFKSKVRIQTLGTGNMILLKVVADIEQIFITTDKSK